MKSALKFPTLLLLVLVSGCLWTTGYAQQSPLPDFLKEKLTWNEKLVVIYAPVEQQHLIDDQINALFPYKDDLKKERITIVQLPVALSASNRFYLKDKLRYQKDRMNIWVIDERGNLRMSCTRPTTVQQFLRVLGPDRPALRTSRLRLL